jgi:hypothetical protein
MNIVNPTAPLNMDMHDASSFPTTGNNSVLDDGLGGYDLIEPAYETANIDLVGSTKSLLCAAPTPLVCDVMYGSFNNGSGQYINIAEISSSGTIGAILGTLSGTTAASAIDPVSKKYFYATTAGPGPSVLNFYDPVT